MIIIVMKHLLGLLLILVSITLVGCGHEAEKKTLQAAFDKYNPQGNRAICVETAGNPKERPNLNQPYDTYTVKQGVYDYEYLNRANNRRKDRLAIFAEVGLLNQQPLAGGEFRYTLTDEGQKALEDRGDRFCFGRVVVTEIEYEKKQDGRLIYYYRYYLENTPDWAKNSLFKKIDSAINRNANRGIDNPGGGPMVLFNANKELVSGDVGSWTF